MLAADADFEIRARSAAKLHSVLDQLAHALLIENRERIVLEDLRILVILLEPRVIVARQAHGRLSQWMLRLAHGFVANSCRARQNLGSRGIKPHKVQVLPNVIDLQDFDARSTLSPRLSLPAGRVITAAVGRLHPCKRFDRFLEALMLARRSEPKLAGVIAGADCGARNALQERANALGMRPPDLTFLGECDRIPALLVRAGLFVLSSDYEGFPNVILEAMAARLPVITTPAGDASLVVQHGKTGYVVEPGDTQGMAAFMVRLARSPSMRSGYGASRAPQSGRCPTTRSVIFVVGSRV